MNRRRRLAISCFVIAWLTLFTYETLRASYLSPLVGRALPKFPLLFPPAGWIMFFDVDKTYGYAEVYGVRGEQAQPLDPHEIFATKGVGYDNIHRNVLIGTLHKSQGSAFCRYLARKFPAYEGFAVVYAVYPDVVNQPDQVLRQISYRCSAR